MIPLHDGVHETPMWGTFLDRLRRRTRADGAALIISAVDRNAADPLERERFLSGRISDLPDPAALQRLRPARIYNEDDIAYGMSSLRIARINEPGARCTAWLLVSRSAEELGATESAVLSGLVPHVATAIRTWSALRQLHGHAAASQDISRRLGGGWIAFNGDGRIVDIDPLAAALLNDTFGMADPIGERLPLGARASALVADAAAIYATDPAAPPQILPLFEAQSFPLLVAAAPEGVPAGLIGYVRAVPTGRHRAAILAALFGLSRSEARLALAMAQGASLAEAAEQLGLTIETARNYSKRIYAKTGTRGQADLVRTILTGPAAFG